MIYNNNIKLTGNEADRFLESVRVAIFEECISINENDYSYEDAQNILSENGISLYDNCIVLEGEQAEEYKKRKAQEKKDAEKAEKKRDNRRYGRFNLKIPGKSGKHYTDEEKKDILKSVRIVGDEIHKNPHNAKNNFDTQRNIKKTGDATYRHMRRHPKQYAESATIFSNIDII